MENMNSSVVKASDLGPKCTLAGWISITVTIRSNFSLLFVIEK